MLNKSSKYNSISVATPSDDVSTFLVQNSQVLNSRLKLRHLGLVKMHFWEGLRFWGRRRLPTLDDLLLIRLTLFPANLQVVGGGQKVVHQSLDKRDGIQNQRLVVTEVVQLPPEVPEPRHFQGAA